MLKLKSFLAIKIRNIYNIILCLIFATSASAKIDPIIARDIELYQNGKRNMAQITSSLRAAHLDRAFNIETHEYIAAFFEQSGQLSSYCGHRYIFNQDKSGCEAGALTVKTKDFAPFESLIVDTRVFRFTEFSELTFIKTQNFHWQLNKDSGENLSYWGSWNGFLTETKTSQFDSEMRNYRNDKKSKSPSVKSAESPPTNYWKVFAISLVGVAAGLAVIDSKGYQLKVF